MTNSRHVKKTFLSLIHGKDATISCFLRFMHISHLTLPKAPFVSTMQRSMNGQNILKSTAMLYEKTSCQTISIIANSIIDRHFSPNLLIPNLFLSSRPTLESPIIMLSMKEEGGLFSLIYYLRLK